MVAAGVATLGLIAYTLRLFILILGAWAGLITGGVPSWGVVKPLVDEAITTITLICPAASMLFYRAALPLSAQTLSYVAGVIAATECRFLYPVRVVSSTPV